MDTSVFGGCLEEPFADASTRLIDGIRKGRAMALVSELVAREMRGAPEPVQDILAGIAQERFEFLVFDQETEDLSQAYLRAGILTKKSETDAGHVALATIARADAIVSWNFKHIVNLDKMKLYNRVNFEQGYGFLEIVTPREVLRDE
jgi:hypothetical protein